MTDVHALSGAYAIDALDDLERAQFERHLADCADCRAEVAGLQEAAALLAETAAVAPSDLLRSRVLASIATVRPLPPVVGDQAQTEVAAVEQPDTAAERRDDPDPEARTSNVRTLRPRSRRFQGLVAAAAAVTVLGAGAAVWQPWNETTQQQPQLSAADLVMQAPDAESYSVPLGEGGKATIVRSRSLNEAVIVAEDMPEVPDGYAYVLWLQHDDVFVPAGTMPEGEDNVVVLDGDAASASGAGITVELADEEPTEPSNAQVAAFAFKQT